MSVRKIRNSWWVDFRFEGVRYRKKSPDNTMAGAKAYEALLRQRLARGEPLRGPVLRAPQTFRSFAEEWFDTCCAPNIKPSTRESFRYTLERVLLPFLGGRRLDEIDERTIEQFKASRIASGVQPDTVNTNLSLLRACLQAGVDWGHLPRAPKVARMRVYYVEKQPLRREEVQRLLCTRKRPPWDLAVPLAVYAGLRIGEILVLRWSDVHLEGAASSLRVRQNLSGKEITSPKGNRARNVPLASALRSVLADRIQREGLVVARRDGGPYARSAAGEALRRTCRRAGIRPIGWHVLRHTFASLLNEAGGNAKAIQELLGHAKLATTERYIHLPEAGLQETVSLLPPLTLPEIGHPVGNAVAKAC